MAKALSAWRQAASDLQNKQQRLQMAVLLFTHTRLTRAWQLWRQVVEGWKAEQALLQGAVAFSVREKLEHAWRSWLLAMRKAQRKVQVAAMAASFSRNWTLAAAWSTWQEAAATSAAERERQQTTQDWRTWNWLVLPFAGWRELAAEGADNSRAADAALRRHMLGVLAHMWLQWHSAVLQQQDLRARMEHCMRRLRHSRLSATFHAWLQRSRCRRAKAAKVSLHTLSYTSNHSLNGRFKSFCAG